MRKWRERVYRARRQNEWKIQNERRKTKERVAKHRQGQEKDGQQNDVNSRIVENLRAHLGKNTGRGTMDKEERTFRRLITDVIVAGPEKVTREEIHGALGIGKDMVAEARKVVAERRQTEIRAPAGRQKSRLVSSALQRRRKATKFLEQRNRVKHFYHSKSTPTSRRQDVVKCWVAGVQETHQRRFLSDSITRLHKVFIQLHGPISRGLFFSLRPQWIHVPTDEDRQVCLCSTHTKLKFAFEDMVKICKKNNIPAPSVDHYVELLDMFLCDEDERTLSCIQEECKSCGIPLLDASLFEPFLQALTCQEVSFRALEKDDNGRLGVQEKCGTPMEFVAHMKNQLCGFPLHRFLSKNQAQEQEYLLRNLNPEVVVIL